MARTRGAAEMPRPLLLAARPYGEPPSWRRHWDNGRLARCGCAGIAIVGATAAFAARLWKRLALCEALLFLRCGKGIREALGLSRSVPVAGAFLEALSLMRSITLPLVRAPVRAPKAEHWQSTRPSASKNLSALQKAPQKACASLSTFFNFFLPPPCAPLSLLLHLQSSAMGRAFRRGAGNPYSPSD